MSIYRRIYEQHNGEIPKDAEGRSYEIHHIDGNHENNDISNLKCVSIQEHYDIHYSQEDWFACYRISKRMNISPEKISELSKKITEKRIFEGTHNLLGPNHNKKLIEKGNHNFIDSEYQRKVALSRVKNGTHPFQGERGREIIEKQIKNGTHQLTITHNCPHCGKSGNGNFFKRWHFDKCKHKNI